MPTLSEALTIAWQQNAAGRSDLAEEICRRVLAVEPGHAQALHLSGVIAFGRGQYSQAAECIARAIEADPRRPNMHNDLGECWRALGRTAEATSCYERAMALDPRHALACFNLGLLRYGQGDAPRAAECYRQAVTRQPTFGRGYNNLGIVLQELGQLEEAVRCFRRTVELMPRAIEGYNNLGLALRAAGRLDEALACFRDALRLKPDDAYAWNNSGTALLNQGNVDEALACYRRAMRLRPDLAPMASNDFCALRYHPGVGARALREAGVEFDRRHAAPLRAAGKPHASRTAGKRPLGVGFVSSSLAAGVVGRFLVRALESLDRRSWNLFFYSDRRAGDSFTERLKTLAAGWVDAAGMSDEALAERIRADRIDILFDLTGHAPRNRLLAFARRPAPVQITWIDSVGTTGLAAMDFLLADGRLVPEGAEEGYVEKVLRMPDSYVCFEPVAEAPPVGPLPALEGNPFTLGSLNNPAKIHAGVVALWARILARLPGARLLLKYRGLADSGTAGRFRALFESHGIGPERLEFQGESPLAASLAEYGRVDLALDPFPHNGGLTTCEALWMGVPVVTCPGETFAGRQGLSHLTTVGLPELIAGDWDEYVEIAVTLASDLPRLAALRASLRPRMAGSPLCDAARFARHWSEILRDVWRT